MGGHVGVHSPRFRLLPTLLAGIAGCVVVMLCTRGTVSQFATFGHHHRFGHFDVGATKILYTSPSGGSAALSEINPVVSGHTIVIPRRSVPRLADLTWDETVDLFESVRTVQRLLVAHYGATAFNIALKDGVAAGQPVPHIHVHVVPRTPGDLPQNDLVYELIDRWAPLEGHVNEPPKWDLPEDEKRFARTAADMAEEAGCYAEMSHDSSPLPASKVTFGQFQLAPSQIFFVSTSGLTLATVNLKPLVPGHVLVIPRRVVTKIEDLTPEEFSDLWSTVRHVQVVVEDCHGASASTVGVQDGRDAGQSVAHVHVHILPLGGNRERRLHRKTAL
eukprot:TRINITY_DN67816_c0_g1_i1.p1 TRINITY_DN67816_c0_g1~~TRINITY_DN67816_c0_g1_i1.p1  ORF type:complete len:332 (+),score=29.49 TRINITY_DN67816_c0_g1_i1:53-1048(+)